MAEPAYRNTRDDLLEHVLGHGGDHVGVDVAWGDGIDGYAEPRAFLRQCLGETVDAAFRRGVIDLTVLARLAVHRTDVDDTAPAALLHPREASLGHVEATAEIDAHDI